MSEFINQLIFLFFGWLTEEGSCEEPLEDENGEWVVYDEY
jgi:hypothetical protein